MLINKIRLVDNGDPFYEDLIIFKRDTTTEEVIKVVQKCKEELPGEYTNEDIYNYLDKEIGIKKMEFMGDCEIIEY